MTSNTSGKRGLGRGLSALMADVGDANSFAGGSQTPGQQVPIELVVPNPDQPRRSFNSEQLEELAVSIGEKGIIQPIVVRPDPNAAEGFEIVAGERRWRAAQIAQLHEIPVIIRHLDDAEVLEIAVIENIQRADLNPIDEALGLSQLMEKFGHTQDKLAEVIGKSRSHIANSIRLLQLPGAVREFVIDGKLSAGHARALITSDDAAGLAEKVIERGLSVRQTEALAKAKTSNDNNTAQESSPLILTQKDADTRMLEGDLSANLGMKVQLQHKPGQEKGQMKINYRSFEELDKLCQLLAAMSSDETR